MDKSKLPEHIAFILDGNRRWAKKNKTTLLNGHKAGFKAIKKIVEHCASLNIKYVSLYAFSTENWNRTDKEIKLLMSLFEFVIKREFRDMLSNGVKLIHIGRKDRLPKKLMKLISRTEEESTHNNKITVYLALDYGGRDEIIRAINSIKKDNIKDEIDEKTFEKYLDLKYKPYPDLLIRTSNEKRISNFLLWQLAYSEFIFIKKLLPDFTIKDFRKCLDEFLNRKRRFGT